MEEVPTRPHPDKVRGTSSVPRPTNSGRPTCSPSCSSGRTAASTWWPSWTITAGSSPATASMPASRRPWCWKWCGRRSGPTARPRRSSPTTAASTSPGGARAPSPGRLEKRGIRQIVARPQRPQTLGKIERFWGTLWRECLETSVFLDLEDARRRIGHFIDYYNFQRPHQGIDGLVPADRFFGAAPEVLRTLAGARGGQRLGAGPQRRAQAAVLRHGADRRPGLQRSCRRRADDPQTRGPVAARRWIWPRPTRQPCRWSRWRRTLSPAAMPLPVCPDGSPQGETDLDEEEPARRIALGRGPARISTRPIPLLHDTARR